VSNAKTPSKEERKTKEGLGYCENVGNSLKYARRGSDRGEF